MKVHEIQSDLWLTKFDYSGDNIGNEFEFVVSRGSSDKSVVKINIWSKIYERLIYCRKIGQKGIVGTVEVIHEER